MLNNGQQKSCVMNACTTALRIGSVVCVLYAIYFLRDSASVSDETTIVAKFVSIYGYELVGSEVGSGLLCTRRFFDQVQPGDVVHERFHRLVLFRNGEKVALEIPLASRRVFIVFFLMLLTTLSYINVAILGRLKYLMHPFIALLEMAIVSLALYHLITGDLP